MLGVLLLARRVSVDRCCFQDRALATLKALWKVKPGRLMAMALIPLLRSV